MTKIKIAGVLPGFPAGKNAASGGAFISMAV